MTNSFSPPPPSDNFSFTPKYEDEVPPKEKSLFVAYLLALPFGWLGLHRFYLGQFFLGFLYFFSLGGFFIGWIIDLLFLVVIVKKENKKRYEKRELSEDTDPLRDIITVEKSENPLSSSIPFLSWIKAGFFLLFMMMLPYFYWSFMGDPVFVTLLFILYFIIAFNKEAVKLAQSPHFFLWSIPIVKDRFLFILRGFAVLRKFYSTRSAPGFIRTVLSPFFLPFSSKMREEWKLFTGLASFGVLFAIFEFASWGYEYLTLYYPNLSIWNMLLEVKLILVGLSSAIVLFYVIPIIRTLTYVDLSGHHKTSKTLVILSIVFFFAMPYLDPQQEYPFENYSRLDLRFSYDSSFTKKVNAFGKNFLRQHFRTTRFSPGILKSRKHSSVHILKSSRVSVATSILLTRRFRRALLEKKLVIPSEVNAFRIIAFTIPFKKTTALSYRIDNDEDDRDDMDDPDFPQKQRIRMPDRQAGWQRVLILYTGYNDGDVDRPQLYFEGATSKKEIIRQANVKTMFHIIVKKMKADKKGDQFVPNFKG